LVVEEDARRRPFGLRERATWVTENLVGGA